MRGKRAATMFGMFWVLALFQSRNLSPAHHHQPRPGVRVSLSQHQRLQQTCEQCLTMIFEPRLYVWSRLSRGRHGPRPEAAHRAAGCLGMPGAGVVLPTLKTYLECRMWNVMTYDGTWGLSWRMVCAGAGDCTTRVKSSALLQIITLTSCMVTGDWQQMYELQ